MMTGQRLTLNRATAAIDVTDKGRRNLVSLPKGSLLEVLSGPVSNNAAALVQIHCEGRRLEMFALDVAERGTIISERRMDLVP